MLSCLLRTVILGYKELLLEVFGADGKSNGVALVKVFGVGQVSVPLQRNDSVVSKRRIIHHVYYSPKLFQKSYTVAVGLTIR